MKNTNAERQARFREKMREAGLVRVSEWVPKEKAPYFRKVAKALRDRKKLLPDA